MTKQRLFLAAAFLSTLLAAAPAHAASGDVEIDPLAYVIDGHSLHVGLRLRHQRFDLGNFAGAAPAAFHGNDGYGLYFSGLGAKYDLCLREDCNGAFAGLDASLARTWITHEDTDTTVTRRQLGVGLRVGYRFSFSDDGRGLYVVPWVSVSYNWFSEPGPTIGGDRFEDRKIGIFPTVHVGWAF